MAAPIMAAQSSADNGFWGSVFSGIGQGIGKVAADVLPVWTAGQLGVDPAGDINNPLGTSLGTVNPTGQSAAMNNFLDAETLNIKSPDANSILAMGIVAVGLILLFKAM